MLFFFWEQIFIWALWGMPCVIKWCLTNQFALSVIFWFWVILWAVVKMGFLNGAVKIYEEFSVYLDWDLTANDLTFFSFVFSIIVPLIVFWIVYWTGELVHLSFPPEFLTHFGYKWRHCLNVWTPISQISLTSVWWTRQWLCHFY